MKKTTCLVLFVFVVVLGVIVTVAMTIVFPLSRENPEKGGVITFFGFTLPMVVVGAVALWWAWRQEKKERRKEMTRFLIVIVLVLAGGPVFGQSTVVDELRPGFAVLPAEQRHQLERATLYQSPAEKRLLVVGLADTLGWKDLPPEKWAEADSAVAMRRANLVADYYRQLGWVAEVVGIELQTPYRGVRVLLADRLVTPVATTGAVLIWLSGPDSAWAFVIPAEAPVVAADGNGNEVWSGLLYSTEPLSVGDLSPGPYWLCASSEAYEPTRQFFRVRPGEQTDVSVVMRPSPSSLSPPRPTEIFVFGHGNQDGFPGLTGLMQFASGFLLGGTFEGEDWDGVNQKTLEGFLGYTPVSSLSLIGGFRAESQLRNKWDSWGGVIGLQYTPRLVGPIHLFGQVGVKRMRVIEYAKVGPLRVFNDPKDSYLGRVRRELEKPERKFWDTEPFFRFGVGLKLK